MNEGVWESGYPDVPSLMGTDPVNIVETKAEGHFAGEYREYDDTWVTLDTPLDRKSTTYQVFVVYDGSTATQYPWLFTLRKGDTNWESATLDPKGDTAHQVALEWWRAFVTYRMFEHVRRGAALKSLINDCYQLVFLE